MSGLGVQFKNTEKERIQKTTEYKFVLQRTKRSTDKDENEKKDV
jgi:hypothetical protein